MTKPRTPEDWRVLHAETISSVRSTFEDSLKTKMEPITRFEKVVPPTRSALILEWRGWYFHQILEAGVMGSEFYCDLPNGKRGLFSKGEEFWMEDKHGFLYRCIEEEAK